MTAAVPRPSPTTASDPILNDLVEEFANRLQAGEPVDLQAYALEHPDQAEQLLRLLPAVQVLVKVRHSSASADASAAAAPGLASPPLHVLGDYRIVREIGRGGMGVVYEAEQQSLGRRVALKVLHHHAGQDARMLARFRRESRAAAQLHHSNIVPVFEVGQQGDRCYYAMQFIRGQALDEVFRELQSLHAGSVPRGASEVVKPAEPLAQSLWTGAYEPADSARESADPEPALAAGSRDPAELITAALPDRSELSSVASDYRRYCRNVARLGLQAAEALAYAHVRGIIHRDIKPANLLLDTTGLLWVSDFGLVKTQDPALTDTGDFVGTLRYMAPERFRGECDARADVYALGLTLYELLVLRPAFDGQDRMHLVEQIGRQEPPRLRTLEPRIPRDLETIVMKAIEKDPRRRYSSAEELASDLRRFLADEPIQARRIGPLERLGRWGRRNPLVAGLSAAIVVVAAMGFVGVLGQWQVALANERKADEKAVQAQEKEQEANQQRNEAQQQRDEAQKQRDEAQRQRDEVRALNDRLRRTLYASNMNLAQHAWEAGGAERVRELLEQLRPKAGETDLRGFDWYYLYRLCHAELLTLKHTGLVNSLAFSPDGKRLASGNGKVWDAQTGQELFTLEGHGVAFSPDGKRLASGDNWGVVKVWDAQTGQELLTLQGRTGSVTSLVFSPDGKRLTSGSHDKPVKVWDAQTGQELLNLQGHTSRVDSVSFSPDGKRLASASADHTVKVWDAQTGQELLTFKGHSGSVWSVAFSPDGKRLASASRDKTAKVWDAQTGQELLTFKGHTYEVDSVAFSPDGKGLASGDVRGMVKVWDAQTGQELLTFKGHTSRVTGLAFSPDGKRLASASWDKTVKVWDAQTGQKPRTLKGTVTSVISVAFSPDGKRLASGSDRDAWQRPGEGKVWDAQTGQELLSFKGGAHCVAFSPDGKRLASAAAADKMVKVWDAQTGQELLSLKGHTGMVFSVAFSPDGKRLASGSRSGPGRGGEVKVWDAQTGQELLSFKGHTGQVNSVVFSPDGKRLATGSGERSGVEAEVKVWDAQTGQELLSLKGHTTTVNSVAFSPDGQRLASGSGSPFGGEYEVKVWDAQTGQELLSLKHVDPVWSVAFSPDGKRLASGSGFFSNRGELKVWDAQTGQELLTVVRDSDWVRSVAFSPNGHWLASGAGDGTVTIWDATPLPEKP
jgi:WD40 repeat protein/serine/threonine protein kinase